MKNMYHHNVGDDLRIMECGMKIMEVRITECGMRIMELGSRQAE